MEEDIGAPRSRPETCTGHEPLIRAPGWRPGPCPLHCAEWAARLRRTSLEARACFLGDRPARARCRATGSPVSVGAPRVLRPSPFERLQGSRVPAARPTRRWCYFVS
eukprot:scaffold547_cov384-Prasinococcus_capsulatus_cf.AAC.26